MRGIRPKNGGDQVRVLGAPKGHEQTVDGLPVIQEQDEEFGIVCHSYWTLTPEEIGILAAGGHVRLSVMGGQPPVAMQAQREDEI